MPDITYDVGRVSFVMKGAWNLATSYEKLDAVSYNGSLYIAKQDVPGGTAITNTTYWQLAAEKGDQGETGGVDSVNGQQGDVWFPDSRQLISDGYTTDTEPFLMKGNGSDSDRFELAKKLGNTVAVNMPIKLRTTSQYGLSASMGADGVITISGVSSTVYSPLWENFTPIVGHYYLLGSSIVANPNNISFSFGFLNCSPNKFGNVGTYAVKQIVTSANSSVGIADFAIGTDFTGVKIRLFVVDLTLWFGSNDRIPSDLLSHPENWGRYYAGSLDYAAGYLDSADGTVLKSIGRNVWDEEWETGAINNTNGQPYNDSNRIRSKTFTPTIPGATYFAHGARISWIEYDINGAYIRAGNAGSFVGPEESFTISADAHLIKFFTVSSYGGTYKNDITISLYYPGESGYDQYYPYSVLAEVDTGSEVLRSAGAAADEKTPDGTITRKVGVVDLGTLTYYRTGSGLFRTDNLIGIVKPTPTSSAIGNIMSASYTAMDGGSITGPDGATPSPNMVMALYTTGSVYINNTAYTDTAAFKTAMSGVYLYYELATPTTEQGTAFEPLVATVKNGVLSWTNTKGIPVGQESHWFENLRKRVEDRLPDPPSGDGTYRLTCTISGGVKTYSWEA